MEYNRIAGISEAQSTNVGLIYIDDPSVPDDLHRTPYWMGSFSGIAPHHHEHLGRALTGA